MVVLMLLMIVVMAAFVMMMVMMLVLVIVLILIVMMVVMLMLILIAVMVVMVLVLLVVIVIVVVMMAAAVVIVVLVPQALHFHFRQLRSQGRLALHGRHQLLAGELIPGSRDDGSHLIVLAQHGNGGVQLELGDGIGAGQNDGGGGLDLVVIELAEVLHIHLDLAGVHHGHSVAQGHIVAGDLVHRADHVGQLAHTGGLDDDPVGGILRDHLFQRPAEIAHQGAADAAGVHLGNVDARVLQKAAVNADLAKLILNQHQLLTLVALRNHLLDQRGLARAQEAGININFGHKNAPFQKILYRILYHRLSTNTRKFLRAFFTEL